ncbi:MAG: cephalosporin hydroxylase family protein [Nitrospira sp.]|nr:cephalosporin hydroxylase family protein [Nitrospira sp.]
MNPIERYRQDIKTRVATYRANSELQTAARAFFDQIGIGKANYVYNFTWLGVPILQIPQDIQAMQEIVWQVKPDLIIETGVAWGGSLMFTASLLAILEACGAIEKGHVIGIDIDIRTHNREAIQAHPLSKKISLIEGSSIGDVVLEKVRAITAEHKRVMVCLDSNHTHDHVLAELEAYAPLVNVGSYCLVGDTIIEDAPASMTAQRPWGKGNSPKTAVWEYIRRLRAEGRRDRTGEVMQFEIDYEVEDKIVLTGSPDGYLKRVK